MLGDDDIWSEILFWYARHHHLRHGMRFRRTTPRGEESAEDCRLAAPRNVREARGFVGIAVYYRIFIANFSVVAAPIFKYFKKNARFRWTEDSQHAMDQLKSVIISVLVLVKLDFSPSALPILKLNQRRCVNDHRMGCGSLTGTSRRARQAFTIRKGIWKNAELKYDALKLECRGLLKALKKLRFWLFRRHFLVETDSQMLV